MSVMLVVALVWLIVAYMANFLERLARPKKEIEKVVLHRPHGQTNRQYTERLRALEEPTIDPDEARARGQYERDMEMRYGGGYNPDIEYIAEAL